MRLTDVPECPICGGEPESTCQSLVDRVCHVEGRWSLACCKKCQTQWLHPRPADDEIGSLYTSEYAFTHSPPELSSKRNWKASLKFAYWNKYVATGEARERRSPVSDILATMVRALPFLRQRLDYQARFVSGDGLQSGRLLEVGCGNGSYLMFMRGLGWQVEGIEPDDAAAKYCRRNGLSVDSHAIEKTGLGLAQYDVVVLHHVIEHLASPATMVSKLMEALKPTGVLISISPNPVSFLAQAFGPAWYGYADIPRHLVLVSPSGFRSMAERERLRARTFTVPNMAPWMLVESLSIRFKQRTGALAIGPFGRALTTIAARVLLAVRPESGEEVVFIGRKT